MAIRVRVGALIVQDDAVLLIEYDEDSPFGRHYSFPGGGLDEGESLHAGLRRELFEEACVEIEVGDLLYVWEYFPLDHDFKYGKTQAINFLFECRLVNGSVPCMPDVPDLNQTAVRWIPLDQLMDTRIIPHIVEELANLMHNKRSTNLFIPFIWHD